MKMEVCEHCGCGFEVGSSDRATSGRSACRACQNRLADSDTIDSLRIAELFACGMEEEQEEDCECLPPSPEELSHLLPEYEVQTIIGQGGMATVYKARQTALQRDVAIKVLSDRFAADKAFAKRFEQEAKLLSRLDHPGIVRVYQSSKTSQGHLWFAMEYVDGTDLGHILSGLELDTMHAFRLFSEICDALHYAHSAGIIHRDLKPSNILISRDGRAKLADFGLCKPIEQTGGLTRSRVVLGTPEYMAPEQLNGRSDQRSDIYSLGILFYEMLCRKLPRGQWLAPSRQAGVDPRLDDIIGKTLESDPARRYQRVSDVKTAVLGALSKAPTPKPRRPRKSVFFVPLLTAAAAVCGGVSVFFLMKPMTSSSPSPSHSPRVGAASSAESAPTDHAAAMSTLEPILAERVKEPQPTPSQLQPIPSQPQAPPSQQKPPTSQPEPTPSQPQAPPSQPEPPPSQLKPSPSQPEPPPSQPKPPSASPIPEFPAPGSIMPEADSPEARAFRAHLVDAEWHYQDEGWSPSVLRFSPTGSFHDRWKWKYWISGPRSLRAQYLDPVSQPTPGDYVTFYFNEEATDFVCEFTDKRGKHVVKGTLLPTTPAPASDGAVTTSVPKEPSASPTANGMPRRDPVVGRWRWDGTVRAFFLHSDGTATEERRGRQGTWTRNWNQGGVYVINWDNGAHIDTMRLSLDRNGLKGENQEGRKLRCDRLPTEARKPKPPADSIARGYPPDPVVGRWKWAGISDSFTLNADGTGSDNIAWKLEPDTIPRRYRIDADNDRWVCYMRLTDNGNTLEGKDHDGVKKTLTRLSMPNSGKTEP